MLLLPVFAPTTWHASPDACRIRNGQTGERVAGEGRWGVDGLRGENWRGGGGVECVSERERGSVLEREGTGIQYERGGSSSHSSSSKRRRRSERGSEERETWINIYTVRRDNSETVIKLVCHISFHYRAELGCKWSKRPPFQVDFISFMTVNGIEAGREK